MATGREDVRIISASVDGFEDDHVVIYDSNDIEKKYDVARSLKKGINAGSQVGSIFKITCQSEWSLIPMSQENGERKCRIGTDACCVAST